MTLPRSTYYYRSTKPAGLTDAELVAIIEDIQEELPSYGYRRVTHELRRRGIAINHKRVARVMRVAGLGIKPRKRRTTDSRHDSPSSPTCIATSSPIGRTRSGSRISPISVSPRASVTWPSSWMPAAARS